MNQVKDYKQVGLTNKFANLVGRRQEKNRLKNVFEMEVKKLSAEILELLSMTGEKTVLCEEWRVTFTSGSNVTIDKRKLLELGVSADIIKKATKVKSYETATITSLKDKDQSEGEADHE